MIARLPVRVLLFAVVGLVAWSAGCSHPKPERTAALPEVSEPAADDLQSQVDDLQARIDELESGIVDIRSACDDVSASIDDLDSAASRFDYENWSDVVGDVRSGISDVQVAASTLDSRIADLE